MCRVSLMWVLFSVLMPRWGQEWNCEKQGVWKPWTLPPPSVNTTPWWHPAIYPPPPSPVAMVTVRVYLNSGFNFQYHPLSCVEKDPHHLYMDSLTDVNDKLGPIKLMSRIVCRCWRVECCKRVISPMHDETFDSVCYARSRDKWW